MDCPKCAYENVTQTDRFCPRCGTSVEIASAVQTLVQVRQDVERNLGNVIGVQTQAIHGDVYGGDIYQVQVYALSGPGRSMDWRAFLDENAAPYKFLSPYTARDQALFKGREDETRQVVSQIGEQRLLVVYGRTGVGKTSLLAAGVIPELMRRGALVVHVRDYARPLEETVRRALNASSNQIPIPLPDELTLPALVRTVFEATQGTLVLVLDQFERLFESSIGEQRRTALVEDLDRALRAVKPTFLRLVIVVNTLERLSVLRDRLPELLRFPFELTPLRLQQAQDAIETPLAVLGYPGGASYVGDLVPRRLVPDLDKLTPEQEKQIQPPHLQIVCSWLYQTARRRPPPQPAHIDEVLYRELKGAKGIMARYLTETLDTQLADRKALAKHVLEALAFPAIGHWVLPERLPSNGASPDQVRDVLDRLADAGLLDRYAINGQHKYAFASFVVAERVRLEAAPEVQRRYQASRDLERVWSEWLAHEDEGLATRTQLRYLDEADAYLTPSAVEVLLLLRSAVARDVPVTPWLARLRKDAEVHQLVRQLEEPAASSQGDDSTPPDEARRLLGLDDAALSDRPTNVGSVAWSAVKHPDAAIRQTAALALTALRTTGAGGALDRLHWALRELGGGWRRWQRRAELRGALSDADPEIAKLDADLPPLDRVGVWLWRVRRRATRDRRRILGLPVGGAIGAGLGLGLLRMAIGALAYSPLANIFLAVYFYWAAILGAAQTLGMGLADPLLTSRPRGSSEMPPIWRAPLHPDRLPDVLAVGLGTLFFGIAHVIVAWLNGLSLFKAPLVAPMGFVAGLGLSLALYAQPRVGWHLGVGRWLARLGTAALTFVLTQWAFIVAQDKGAGIAVALSGSFYHAEFSDHQMPWWQWFMGRFARWFDYLALLDAALVGLVLAVGTTAGLLLAARWLARWKALIDRAVN